MAAAPKYTREDLRRLGLRRAAQIVGELQAIIDIHTEALQRVGDEPELADYRAAMAAADEFLAREVTRWSEAIRREYPDATFEELQAEVDLAPELDMLTSPAAPPQAAPHQHALQLAEDSSIGLTASQAELGWPITRLGYYGLEED